MKKSLYKSVFSWDKALILSVFLCAFVIPVFPPSWGQLPARIGFTLIFLSGVLFMEKISNRILFFAMTAFLMEWVSQLFDLEIIASISRGLNIIFFAIVIASLFREIATAKVVTAQVILSAMTGYILLGIIFSVVVAAVIKNDQGAFNLALKPDGIKDASAHLSESMYFGFVTLASLGYGDILPLKPYSRSLATFIAISGQLYIAAIIGMLIGKYVSRNDLTETKN
jgi:voltage-gated potassium channel